MQKNFTLAFLKPCPKHLENNLKEKGFSSELIKFYWKASNAKTKFQYDSIMDEMIKVTNGNIIKYE